MTERNRPRPHTTTADGDRGHRVRPGRVRDERIRRVFDGVVASYIRDISAPGDVHDGPGHDGTLGRPSAA